MTLLAPRDVGRRLRLSTSRVIQLDREGRLRAIRDSAGRRYYNSDVVEAFAKAREARLRGEALPAGESRYGSARGHPRSGCCRMAGRLPAAGHLAHFIEWARREL